MHMVDAPDDAELLSRYAQARDDTAFTELVRRYVALVYHAARRQVGDDHRAEEITQEVFTRLARKAPGLAAHTSLAGWLHATTRHASLESLRAERRRRAREREAFLMNEAMSGGRDPEWERIRPALDEALGELAADDREVVLWRYFLGLSWREVGSRLGAAENTARMRGDRALERLRSRLAKRGWRSTAAVLAAGLTAEAIAAVPSRLAGQVASGATASASTAAITSAGSVIVFMSAIKTGWITAGLVVLAGLLGVGWHQEWESKSAHARAAELHTQAALLTAETRELDSMARASEVEIARLAARQVAAPAPQRPTEAAWDPVTEGSALMARHPGLARAVLERADAITAYRYGPWLKRLNLTPEQSQRFFALMRSSNNIGAPFGPRGEMFLFMADEQLSKQAADDGLRELLGSGFGEMESALRETRAREELSKFAKRLVFSETPLTDAQVRHMLAVMVTTPQTTSEGDAPKGFDWTAITAKLEVGFSEQQKAAWAAVRKRGDGR